MLNLVKAILALLILGLIATVALALIPSKTKTPPTPEEDVSFVVHIPQKALHRNMVTVSVETTPGTDCELSYISPSGDISKMDTKADAIGVCSWTWKVDETKGKGSGRLIFKIGGMSETHFIEIRSSF